MLARNDDDDDSHSARMLYPSLLSLTPSDCLFMYSTVPPTAFGASCCECRHYHGMHVCLFVVQLLQDYGTFLDDLGNWELVMWCMCLGVYLLRFITLGTKINKKYRNFSVLITEQVISFLHCDAAMARFTVHSTFNAVMRI